MTTRQRLKKLYYGMLVGTVMIVPGLGVMLLRYTNALDQSAFVSMIASADIGIIFLFGVLFRCPRCRSSLLGWTQPLLNGSGACNCPRCGLDLDR